MVQEKINKDLREALRQKENLKILTLKLLLAAFQNKEIELRSKGEKLTEKIVLEIIKKEAKKRKEAIVIYEKSDRSDLLEKEKKELVILESYLPLEISDEEIIKIIQNKINSLVGQVNFGKIMGEVIKEVAGQADSSRVADLLKKELNES